MSTGFPDHAQSNFGSVSQSSPQSIPQMSGIALPRSSPGPIAGGAGGQIAHGASVEEQKNGGATKKVKTRSVDYVLRSGLAGGLAGCAVSAWDFLLGRFKTSR